AQLQVSCLRRRLLKKGIHLLCLTSVQMGGGSMMMWECFAASEHGFYLFFLISHENVSLNMRQFMQIKTFVIQNFHLDSPCLCIIYI
uniref:Uncharacterized protein n=1 Tax=Oryzias melastigma TaxID=30732 RepID=A0A3B3BZC1_ORYME